MTVEPAPPALPAALPDPTAGADRRGNPPHNLTAETSVLGAMILDPAAVDEARRLLIPEDFYRGAHRTIYETVLGMVAARVRVDPVTLTDGLERRGLLEHVGGPTAVGDLIGKVPTAAHITHYAAVVADLARRRRLADAAAAAAKDAHDLTVDVDLAVARLRGQVETVRTGARLRAFGRDEMDSLPDPVWIVGDLLPDGFAALWGPSTLARKTFLALDWACSIAAGADWFGRPVRRSPVVYVQGEGSPSRFAQRRQAWEQHHGVTADGLYVIPRAIDLLDPRDAAELAAIVGWHGARFVVLDTFARTMSGNEDKTEVMSAYVRAVDTIRQDNNAAALVLHHPPAEPARMRGNQAFYAACDAVVAAVPDTGEFDDPAARPVTYTTHPPRGKPKDSEPGVPIRLRLRKVGPSAVLVPAAASRDDTRGFVLAALADQPDPMIYPDLVGFAERHGGDRQMVDAFIQRRQVVQVPGKTPRSYVAAAEPPPQLAHWQDNDL